MVRTERLDVETARFFIARRAKKLEDSVTNPLGNNFTQTHFPYHSFSQKLAKRLLRFNPICLQNMEQKLMSGGGDLDFPISLH